MQEQKQDQHDTETESEDVIDAALEAHNAVEEAEQDGTLDRGSLTGINFSRMIQSASNTVDDISNLFFGQSMSGVVTDVSMSSETTVVLTYQYEGEEHVAEFDLPMNTKQIEAEDYPILWLVNYVGLSVDELPKLEGKEIPVLSTDDTTKVHLPSTTVLDYIRYACFRSSVKRGLLEPFERGDFQKIRPFRGLALSMTSVLAITLISIPLLYLAPSSLIFSLVVLSVVTMYCAPPFITFLGDGNYQERDRLE